MVEEAVEPSKALRLRRCGAFRKRLRTALRHTDDALSPNALGVVSGSLFARALPWALFGQSPSSSQGRLPSEQVMRPNQLPDPPLLPALYTTVPVARLDIA